MARDELNPTRWDPDIAYGQTPAKALWGVIVQSPGLDSPDGAEYIAGRPDFMDRKTGDADRYDWDQHETISDAKEAYTLSPEDGPRVRVKTRWQTVDGTDNRIGISISNVWLEVDHFREDTRAEAEFSFYLLLRETTMEGDDYPRTGEKHWQCELKSTNPL